MTGAAVSGGHSAPADHSLDLAVTLSELVWGCPWMIGVLKAVEEAGLPDAWVGAGAIRDMVWDSLFGSGFDPEAVKDVDVAFCDPRHLSRARDEEAEERLHALDPHPAWDAKNQAAVH